MKVLFTFLDIKRQSHFKVDHWIIAVYSQKETMREQQARAIEKRLQENEKRGIKNVDKVRADAMRKSELERRQEEADRNRGAGNQNQLRVLKQNEIPFPLMFLIHVSIFSGKLISMEILEIISTALFLFPQSDIYFCFSSFIY